ncbi:MAG: hypothetical protein ACI86H_002310 [bacterium]|jgi:hypothetical protein
MLEYLMNYAIYVQYPLLIIILVYSLLSMNPLKKKEITLVVFISFFGVISYVFGVSLGMKTNIRAIIVPLIFYVVINSRSDKLLKIIFWYCLVFTIIEEALFFSGVSYWGILTRFIFLRPYGGFFDNHLSGLFLASTLYIFGHKYLGGFLATIFLSLQTPVVYSIAFLNKKNIKFAILFSGFIIYLLYTVGHLKIEQKDSMLNAYISMKDYSYGSCYLTGCSANIINTEKIKNKGSYRFIDDIGFLRVLYFFGVPWFLFYTLLVFKKSKSVVIPLIYWLTILHYPVVFGLLTTVLLAMSINYYNRHIFPQYISIKPHVCK